MTYWADFSEGGQVRDAYHNLVASFSFINTRVGGRKDPDLVKSQADLLADALNVHEATGLTPSQLQARVAELEAALATQDRILRSSVPERWKGCTSPVGSAQNYIAELEQALLRVRQEAVADDQDDWFRAAGEAIEP